MASWSSANSQGGIDALLLQQPWRTESCQPPRMLGSRSFPSWALRGLQPSQHLAPYEWPWSRGLRAKLCPDSWYSETPDIINVCCFHTFQVFRFLAMGNRWLIQGHTIDTSDLESCLVSGAPIQLCYSSWNAARDDPHRSEHSCVLMKCTDGRWNANFTSSSHVTKYCSSFEFLNHLRI